MKQQKAKPEHELIKIMEEKEKNLFIICERCGYVYKDPNSVPARCIRCGNCVLCLN